MRKIIIINGMGGSGKDSFVKACQNIDPTIQNISSVNYVKQVAYELGWDGAKDTKGRRFLSDLKMALSAYNDAPFIMTIKDIEDYDKNATVFVHIRESDDISKYKAYFEHNGDIVTTVVINNSRVKPITSNLADADVYNSSYDWIIDNEGTLDDLAQSAEFFLKNFEKEIKKRSKNIDD